MMYNKRGIIPHKLLIIDPFERPEIFLKNPSGEESIINKEENESDGIFTMRTPRRATVPKQVNRIMGIRLGKQTYQIYIGKDNAVIITFK